MLLGAIAASAVFMGWDGRVVSAPIGGGTLTPLVTGLNGPYGIAVA